MTRSITRTRSASVLRAGAAATAALLLAGCGAGQHAETAVKEPSVPGANAQVDVKDAAGTVIGLVTIRNLLVPYADMEGYAKDEPAPISVALTNDSPRSVTVTIAPAPAAETPLPQRVNASEVVLAGGDAAQPAATPSVDPTGSPSTAPTGEATGEPTGGPTENPSGEPADPNATSDPGAPSEPPASPTEAPQAPSGQQAQITIPAHGVVIFNGQTDQVIQLRGLSGDLKPGYTTDLTFAVSGSGLASTSVVVTAAMGPPASPAPRVTASLQEEGGGH